MMIVTIYPNSIQNIVDPLPIIPMDIAQVASIDFPLFVFCPLLFGFDDAVRLLDFVRGVRIPSIIRRSHNEDQGCRTNVP